MIGNLSYNAAGTVAATKGITGDINFKGNDGVFNLGNGSTIDGAVTSTDSVAGSLYFIGDGEVTGGVEAKKSSV